MKTFAFYFIIYNHFEGGKKRGRKGKKLNYDKTSIPGQRIFFNWGVHLNYVGQDLGFGVPGTESDQQNPQLVLKVVKVHWNNLTQAGADGFWSWKKFESRMQISHQDWELWNLLLWGHSQPTWTHSCVTWVTLSWQGFGLHLLRSLPAPTIPWGSWWTWAILSSPEAVFGTEWCKNVDFHNIPFTLSPVAEQCHVLSIHTSEFLLPEKGWAWGKKSPGAWRELWRQV